MVSAISNKGHVEFMILDGTFNGGVFLEFLVQLVKYKQQKIFLVVDGHSAHKTKAVKAWLEENKERIELFFYHPIALN
ncbi:MAG: transposase [Chitinophagaceae bacterium]|nr:transposase [Chitinophagaceae bacterium]